MRIYVGASGYGYKEWKGVFYPPKISPKEMLRFYSERFSAVEINNTFYHMPTEKILMSWADQVPDDFIFAVKAPQVLTHVKRLKNVEPETKYLFNTLSVLSGKLGPVLFQFPKSFHADAPTLKDFLILIPRTIPCAFEFRSSSWFNPEILNILGQKGCSLCIADSAENPVNEIISTAPWGYIRLRRSDYKDSELLQWKKRIFSQKWEKAFVFFKHEEETEGPVMASRFHDLTISSSTPG
jgi:uncharacterized protein YecE (DUF72 family)